MISTAVFREKKEKARKIVMITAYDSASAEAVHAASADIVLVGDSLGVTVLGYQTTREVTLADMEHHLKAVVRGAPQAFIVCDMPFQTYDTPESAMRNAQTLIDTGCAAVKIEGCNVPVIKSLVNAGIPVMGHAGVLPQTATEYKVRGKNSVEAARLREETRQIQDAGCFAIVLECMSAALAKTITQELFIPTIGIGAGKECDGQVLVFNDLLGIFTKFKPKFVRHYKGLKKEMIDGCATFACDVRSGAYPLNEESYR